MARHLLSRGQMSPVPPVREEGGVRSLEFRRRLGPHLPAHIHHAARRRGRVAPRCHRPTEHGGSSRRQGSPISRGRRSKACAMGCVGSATSRSKACSSSTASRRGARSAIRALATELVRLPADAIVTWGTAASLRCQRGDRHGANRHDQRRSDYRRSRARPRPSGRERDWAFHACRRSRRQTHRAAERAAREPRTGRGAVESDEPLLYCRG